MSKQVAVVNNDIGQGDVLLISSGLPVVDGDGTSYNVFVEAGLFTLPDGPVEIPIVTNDNDFQENLLVVAGKDTAVVEAYIWENDGLVYYSNTGFHQPGTPEARLVEDQTGGRDFNLRMDLFKDGEGALQIVLQRD